MEKRQCTELGIDLGPMVHIEVLASFEAAGPNDLEQVEGATPAQVQAVLEALLDTGMFAQHAWSVASKVLGECLGCGLGSVVERCSDLFIVSSAGHSLLDKVVEQIGDGLARRAIPLVVCDLSRD